MDDRGLRLASLVEWVAAAVGVVALGWILSVPVQRLLGPRVQAAIADAANDGAPPGVPSGSTVVPVLLLLDGREIRHGELQSGVEEILPSKYAAGAPKISSGRYGPRHAREYIVDGSRFFVVCERLEPGGPMKVAGIYLPPR